MHILGCPKRNDLYANCCCAAIEQREHTEQLRRYNDFAPSLETLETENESLRQRIKELESKLN